MSWALLGGAGFYGLQDQFTISADSVMEFEIDESNRADLIRTEMKRPIGLGGFAYLDILPVDLEVFGEISFSSYEYQFRTFDATSGGWLDTLSNSIKFPWARYSYGFTVRKPIFKVPMFRINAGAGINMAGVLPIIDEKYIVDSWINQPLNQSEDQQGVFEGYLKDKIKEEIKKKYAGAHVQIGVQFKPLLIPFALYVNARYTIFMSDGVLLDKKGFLNLWAGLAFHI